MSTAQPTPRLTAGGDGDGAGSGVLDGFPASVKVTVHLGVDGCTFRLFGRRGSDEPFVAVDLGAGVSALSYDPAELRRLACTLTDAASTLTGEQDRAPRPGQGVLL